MATHKRRAGEAPPWSGPGQPPDFEIFRGNPHWSKRAGYAWDLGPVCGKPYIEGMIYLPHAKTVDRRWGIIALLPWRPGPGTTRTRRKSAAR